MYDLPEYLGGMLPDPESEQAGISSPEMLTESEASGLDWLLEVLL